MACNIETILSNACSNGFLQAANTDPKLAKALMLQLLCNISSGGTGGGGTVGTGAPTGTPTAGTTYLDTATNNFWVYNGSAWVEIVGN
jgi:hypothetical protein